MSFYRHFVYLFAFFAVSILSVPPLLAAEDKIEWLIKSYNQVVKDRVKFKAAYETGRERSAFCSYCHGADGNSLQPEVPNLASQNPVYLWKQIDNFATGKRKNFVMQSLAKDLSNDEKLALAIFFSSNKVKPNVVKDETVLKAGKALYKNKCLACHGETGGGNREIARLAGQRAEYIRLTLKNFRKNARNPEQATESSRRSSLMESVIKSYTNDEIDKLATYISTMP